jgi:hypothetical protein
MSLVFDLCDTDGPPDVYLESHRTSLEYLAKGLLPGPSRMYPWFDRMCPLGGWITKLRVSADSIITQILAVCNDGTELWAFPQQGATDSASPSMTSATGFAGFHSRTAESGVCAIQYVLRNGSTSEVYGVSDTAECATEVKLLCPHDGERLKGFYGQKTLVNMNAAVGALGVICGMQGGFDWHLTAPILPDWHPAVLPCPVQCCMCFTAVPCDECKGCMLCAAHTLLYMLAVS